MKFNQRLNSDPLALFVKKPSGQQSILPVSFTIANGPVIYCWKSRKIKTTYYFYFFHDSIEIVNITIGISLPLHFMNTRLNAARMNGIWKKKKKQYQ